MPRKQLASKPAGTRTRTVAVRKSKARTSTAKTGAAPGGATAVDRYIEAQPAAVRAVLARVRQTIRRAIPRAEEGISYGIPTFKHQGRPVLYFAAWQRHYSLYPSNTRLVAAFRQELKPYEVSKGTIRFPLDQPVPVSLIAAIAKFRWNEVRAA